MWSFIRQIGLQLDQAGVPWLPIDSFVVKSHAKQVLQVYDLLNDKRSKQIYASLIKMRVIGSAIPEEYIDNNQYYRIVR